MDWTIHASLIWFNKRKNEKLMELYRPSNFCYKRFSKIPLRLREILKNIRVFIVLTACFTFKLDSL